MGHPFHPVDKMIEHLYIFSREVEYWIEMFVESDNTPRTDRKRKKRGSLVFQEVDLGTKIMQSLSSFKLLII